MNIQEARRAAFLAWLQDRHGLDSVWQEDRNCFKDFPAHLAFQAWNAALDSVCVTVPQDRIARGYGEQVADALGFNDGVSYCVQAIEAAGIRCEVAK